MVIFLYGQEYETISSEMSDAAMLLYVLTRGVELNSKFVAP